MKRWEKSIQNKWLAGASHTFLLYLNVNDDIRNNNEEKFESLTGHIISETVLKDAAFIALFNRGEGIFFATEEMEEKFLYFLQTLYPDKDPYTHQNIAVAEFNEKRVNLDYALKLFSKMLGISWQSSQESAQAALRAVFPKKNFAETKTPFFAVILEYAETITPTDSATTCHEADRNALVMIEVWAKSQKIAQARNIIILLSESLSMIAPALRSETTGVVPLKLNFPDLNERKQVIEISRKEYKPQPSDISAGLFTNLSAGMSCRVIRNLIKESHLKQRALAPEEIFLRKKKFMEEQSGGMLEIVRPLWGLKAIGGLETPKIYILDIVSAMKNNEILAVPMGILLLGEPGTGKTIFAEAMAYEAGLPFVKMKNIREKWVGQSERNLDLALELIITQAPVVLFVDEIDQQYQSRDVMADNTGVNNRIQARIFEFMSDTTLRGKVLVIAASNRPDLLDPAMLRPGRFDEKIPFFPPNAKERGEILRALLHKMQIQTRIQNIEFNYEIEEEFYGEFGWLAHWHQSHREGIARCDPEEHTPDTVQEEVDEIPLTGAEIEKILKDAYQIAAKEKTCLRSEHIRAAFKIHLPSADLISHGRMTDLALLHSSGRFLSGKWEKRARLLRAQPSGEKQSTLIVK